jgi:PAS domain S-box-containing protein
MIKDGAFAHSLIFRLTIIVLVGIIGSFGFIIYEVIESKRKDLLDERLRASELMSQTILNTIYDDMLAGRADMARHLIAGLKTLKGVERVQVIRNNGIEEAFQDFKTLNAVEERLGEIKPEWVADHQRKKDVRAEGIDYPIFKEALHAFKEGDVDNFYYTEKTKDKELFTYIALIKAKEGCQVCHGAKESARGFLMISTSLEEQYLLLAETRGKWITYGVTIIIAASLAFFILLRLVLTRRIREMMNVSSEWGKGNLDARMPHKRKDELGMLEEAFNTMAGSLKLHQEEVLGLYEDVRRGKNEWEKTFDSIEEMILIIDRNYRILRANKAVERRLNKPLAEVLGSSCNQIIFGIEDRSPGCFIEKVVETKKPQSAEIDVPKADGTFWVTSYPFTFDEDGEVSTIIHVMTDVTHLKNLARTEMERKRLEDVSGFKSRVISIVSHEIRNPMTSIMGYIELMKTRDVSKSIKKRWFEIILSEAKRIEGLVDDILNLSKVEAGKLKIEKGSFDMEALTRDVVELFINRSDIHRIDLEISTLLPTVYGDRGKLFHVISNLLDNAIKYSPGGGNILMKADIVNGQVRVSVKDEGVGIPPEYIERIFEPFQRVESKEAMAIKGIGIGLSICKTIIELHGGRIWAENNEGKGSIFYITIPFEAPTGKN